MDVIVRFHNSDANPNTFDSAYLPQRLHLTFDKLPNPSLTA